MKKRRRPPGEAPATPLARSLTALRAASRVLAHQNPTCLYGRAVWVEDEHLVYNNGFVQIRITAEDDWGGAGLYPFWDTPATMMLPAAQGVSKEGELLSPAPYAFTDWRYIQRQCKDGTEPILIGETLQTAGIAARHAGYSLPEEPPTSQRKWIKLAMWYGRKTEQLKFYGFHSARPFHPGIFAKSLFLSTIRWSDLYWVLEVFRRAGDADLFEIRYDEPYRSIDLVAKGNGLKMRAVIMPPVAWVGSANPKKKEKK